MCSGAASPSLQSECVCVLPLNQRFGPATADAADPEQPGMPESSASPSADARTIMNSARFCILVPAIDPASALPGFPQRDAVEVPVENDQVRGRTGFQPAAGCEPHRHRGP